MALQSSLMIGILGSPCGLSGELRLNPENPDTERLHHLKQCSLEGGQILTIQAVRYSGKKIFLKFKEICTREQAATYSGRKLYAEREDLPELAENTWYDCDLIGLNVFTNGKDIGQIKAVLHPSAQALLVIAKSGEKDLYCPFLQRFIEKVDLDSGRIDLFLPEGLYDLYRS